MDGGARNMRRLTRGRGVPRPLVATAPRRRVRPVWHRRATPMVLIGLAAAPLVSGRRWTLLFNTRVDVRLPA